VAGLFGSAELSSDPEFCTTEQEVLKLLEECAELRRTLKTIGAQVGPHGEQGKARIPKRHGTNAPAESQLSIEQGDDHAGTGAH
jgi:hypothetical protein